MEKSVGAFVSGPPVKNDAIALRRSTALTVAMQTGERWAIAEVLRVKARLLSTTGVKADQLETLLVESLTVARRQRARCWYDPARFSSNKGGARLFRSIYDQFAEGFDTMNLQEAKSLMETVEKTCRSRQSDPRGLTREPHLTDRAAVNLR